MAISSAHAATGRVVFSGAVVDSTRPSEDAPAVAQANAADQANRHRLRRTVTDPGAFLVAHLGQTG
jgi:hypothetical protein